MDLTEFLTARLAEDERVSRELQAGYLRHYGSVEALSEPQQLMWGFAARVLREVEAKRAVVALLAPFGGCPGCPGCLPVLAHLAAVYSDHPDFDESWRP